MESEGIRALVLDLRGLRSGGDVGASGRPPGRQPARARGDRTRPDGPRRDDLPGRRRRPVPRLADRRARRSGHVGHGGMARGGPPGQPPRRHRRFADPGRPTGPSVSAGGLPTNLDWAQDYEAITEVDGPRRRRPMVDLAGDRLPRARRRPPPGRSGRCRARRLLGPPEAGRRRPARSSGSRPQSAASRNPGRGRKPAREGRRRPASRPRRPTGAVDPALDAAVTILHKALEKHENTAHPPDDRCGLPGLAPAGLARAALADEPGTSEIVRADGTASRSRWPIVDGGQDAARGQPAERQPLGRRHRDRGRSWPSTTSAAASPTSPSCPTAATCWPSTGTASELLLIDYRDRSSARRRPDRGRARPRPGRRVGRRRDGRRGLDLAAPADVRQPGTAGAGGCHARALDRRQPRPAVQPARDGRDPATAPGWSWPTPSAAGSRSSISTSPGDRVGPIAAGAQHPRDGLLARRPDAAGDPPGPQPPGAGDVRRRPLGPVDPQSPAGAAGRVAADGRSPTPRCWTAAGCSTWGTSATRRATRARSPSTVAAGVIVALEGMDEVAIAAGVDQGSRAGRRGPSAGRRRRAARTANSPTSPTRSTTRSRSSRSRPASGPRRSRWVRGPSRRRPTGASGCSPAPKLSHDGWMSCQSCHTDGHTNSLAWRHARRRLVRGAEARALAAGRRRDRPLDLDRLDGTAGGPGAQVDRHDHARDEAGRRPGRRPDRVSRLAGAAAAAARESGADDRRHRARREVFRSRKCASCHEPPEYTSPQKVRRGPGRRGGQPRVQPPFPAGRRPSRRVPPRRPRAVAPRGLRPGAPPAGTRALAPGDRRPHGVPGDA